MRGSATAAARPRGRSLEGTWLRGTEHTHENLRIPNGTNTAN